MFEPVIIISKDSKHSGDTTMHTYSTQANRVATGESMPMKENKHSNADNRLGNSQWSKIKLKSCLIYIPILRTTLFQPKAKIIKSGHDLGKVYCF